MSEDFTIKIVNTYSVDNNKTYTDKSFRKDIDRAFQILDANPNILYDANSIKVSTEITEDDDDAVYCVVFKFTVTVFDMPDKILRPSSKRLQNDGVESDSNDKRYVDEDELLDDLEDVEMNAIAMRFVIYIMSEHWLLEAGLEPLPEKISDATAEQRQCLLENIIDRYVPEYTLEDVDNLLALGDDNEV